MRTALLMLAFTSTLVAAQAPPPDGPRFEVVSIKRNISPEPFSARTTERPDGGFTSVSIEIMDLLRRSRFPPIAPVNMVGLPAWAGSLDGEAYDVSATSPLGRPATPEERAAMIHAMLVERFKLVAGVEKRRVPAYDLVLARSDGRLGPAIAPSTEECVAERHAAQAAAGPRVSEVPAAADRNVPSKCHPIRILRGLEGDMTMGEVARFLRGVDRPVVDRTGLTGSYFIRLEFDVLAGIRPLGEPTPDGLPSVFSILPEQLGLKLEPSTTERDFLIIERLERPTEN